MEIIDQPADQGNQKSLESVLSDGYTFNLGNYLSEGFKLFGSDAGNFIGYVLVYLVISIALSMIPFIGTLGGLIVNPALLAGIFVYARLLKRGQPKAFGNFFDGFKSPLFLQLFLQNLVTTIFIVLAIGIVVVPFFFSTILEFAKNADAMQHMDQEEMGRWMLSLFSGNLAFGILLAILIAATVGVLYCLAPMFVVFRGLGFWEAMEASRKVVAKNFFQFLIFLILLGVIGIIGAMLCGVGLLVAFPVIYLVMFAAFDDIMGA